MFVSTCIERDSWQSLSVGQPCSWKRIPGLAERLQAATGEEPWAVCLSVRACLAHSLGGPACLQAQFEPACSLLPVCQAGPPDGRRRPQAAAPGPWLGSSWAAAPGLSALRALQCLSACLSPAISDPSLASQRQTPVESVCLQTTTIRDSINQCEIESDFNTNS